MGRVLNRTTNKYLTSVNTPDYDPVDWVINPDTTPVTGIAPKFWHILGDDTLREMTVVEKETAYLGSNKTARIQEIDVRTVEIIGTGFIHATKQFSLSLEAQINWTNAGLNAAALSYPYRVATKDDGDYYDFVDAADMQTAYGTALSVKAVALSGGADLKKQINEAADQAALDAVVDSR